VRIERLDLIRYGAFTDRSLVLAPAVCDMQIVFGPNEAGKSTARAALEDLLFGIEERSPYGGFLHVYSALRLGGLVSEDGQCLDFRRRKGRRDTLTNPADETLPGGEAALAPFLNGVTKDFLRRMFALSHERLQAGGREMLDAKGEAGQALFSAGTGLADLRHRMRDLEEQADALWAPRASGNRAWYVAKADMEAAAKNERELITTAAKLQAARSAVDKAAEECKRLEQERLQLRQEQNKLGRIRRVYRNVQSLADTERELAELGPVTAFPEDAQGRLDAALRAHSSAQSSIDTLAKQIEQEKQDRDREVCDEDLLARAEDVALLKEQRIQVRKEKDDLPQRNVDLANAEQQLIAEAEQLEWLELGPDDIIKRIPRNARVTAATKLAAQRGGLDAAVNAARTALDEADTERADLEATLKTLPPASDVTALAAMLADMRAADDPAGRVTAAERERREAQAAIDRLLATLDPVIDGVERLETLPIPPIDTLTTRRDQLRVADQRVREATQAAAAKKRDIDARRAKLRRRVEDEHVVTTEVLASARATREAGWRLVRARYIDATEIPEADIAAFQGDATDLPEAFERETGNADDLADQRFEKAQAAGELAASSKQLADDGADLDALTDASDAAVDALAEEQRAWTALWAPCGLEPRDPDVMLRWMKTRGDAIEALGRRRAAERALKEARADETAVRESLLDELGRVAADHAALEGKTLGTLVEFATNVQREHAHRAEGKRSTQSRIQTAAAGVERKRKRLREDEDAFRAWQARWDATVVDLQLPPGTETDAALVMFESIGTLRDLAKTITDLRIERIAKMERDITGFEGRVAEFVAAAAGDLAGIDPYKAVVELGQRLAKAAEAKKAQASADKRIASLSEDLKKATAGQDEANRVVRELQQIAGSADLDQLKTAMQRAAQASDLSSKQAELTGTILKDGDGHTLDDLRGECAGVDLDKAAARGGEIDDALQGIQNRLNPAIQARLEAEQALKAIGAGDAAAQAAARREEALTDMRTAAERYVRARTAVVMLRWAIDRYQREKQAPLLQRATSLFAALTSGSFVGVRAEFDDKDHATLEGVRANESAVGVAGMSEGTVDQLFLALRLAAIYEYIEHSPPMPVIADDLLINFDDERAEAALRVLAELARHTQVIFFTHHQHLVDIARSTLGADAHITSWDRAN
jgi:uncharacterized protein YhaN